MIPHCYGCERRQVKETVAGLAVGAICVIAVLVLWPPAPDDGVGVLLYGLFGYPIYLFITTVRKGVVFASAGSKAFRMHIRNAVYFDMLVAFNSPATSAQEVPLAGKRGVWRH